MSIATTLARLRARLEAISSPEPFKKVYSEPREAVDLGSFPAATLALDPDAPHVWSMAANGLARHDYTVGIWVWVGARAAGLPELHSRALIWPEPIARALYSGLTLGDAVEWIGDGGSGQLLTYTIGVEEWAGRELFRLKLSLPVTEKIPMPMDA